MNPRHLFRYVIALMVAGPAAASELKRADLQALLRSPVGATTDIAAIDIEEGGASITRLKRVDVYAPDAQIMADTGAGLVSVPRSKLLHFVAVDTDGMTRFAFSISPDGETLDGMLLSSQGRFSLRSIRKDGGIELIAERRPKLTPEGEPIYFACENDNFDMRGIQLPTQASVDEHFEQKAGLGALRTAIIAYDTDTELFAAPRFSSGVPLTNVTNYLATLTNLMNVVYERDLDVTLQQGTTLLRNAADPYTSANGTANGEHLDEFADEWFVNQSAVNRAFAARISGKSGSNNSASGIAWVLGDSNMCAEKGFACPNPSCGNCADGSCTVGHYSENRIFKFSGATAADDVLIVAHELGHNFGASHTHCTDTSAAPGVQAIDQCISGAGSGCYSGATSCPAAQTINGVANVTGTLMSYCHLSGIGGCDSFEVFHPFHEAQLRTVATNNVTSGCFTTGGAPGTFTIANASITEGNSGTQNLNFVVTRTGGSGSGSVTATTANGTATTADGDYVSKTQVLNFAAAGTQNFAVTINGDTRDEDNETFTVTLSAPSAGFSLGSPSSATGTITDNDNPPTVGINSPAAVAEGSTITFTVSLSAASGKAISVNHTTASGGGASGATEGSDFSDATGTLNFAAGETSKTFNVSTTNDALDEADTETFTATLSAPTNATLGTSSGTGSINDNDPLPSVSIADTAVTEGDNLQFTVTLTPVSGRTVTVPFSTADGTATVAGNDYLQTSSSIQIAAGNGSGTIIVNTLQDSVDEPNETLTVNLGTPTNATVGDGSATGTILDDDITAGVVSIADASLTEGNAASTNMSFTVSIPAPLAQATSVTYGVVPLDATPVLDYTAVTGTATIGAGNTSTTINVPIIGDTLDEWDEQFLVNIVATASSTIGDGQAVGTIIDNDSGGDPVFRNGFE